MRATFATLLTLALFASSTASAGLFARLGGNYSTGTYTVKNETDNAQAGMTFEAAAGYRLETGGTGIGRLAGLGFGIDALLGFPQMDVIGSKNEVSYRLSAAGVSASYLWGRRFEPFLSFYPLARLTETEGASSSEPETIFHGHATNLGVRFWLPGLNDSAAGPRVGFSAAYLHENYTRGAITNRNVPTETNELSGSSLQLGMFLNM